MTSRWVVAVGIAIAACNGDDKPRAKPAPSPPVAVADAGMLGQELKLVGCAPAMAAPSLPQGGQGPATPRVTLGTLTVTGPLAKGKVAQMMTRHANRFAFCYEQRLVKHLELDGSSKLTLSIEPSGRVFEAHVEDSIDDELSLCLKHIVSELKFPEAGPQAKARTRVSQAMTFAWKPAAAPAPAPPEPSAWTPFAASAARAPASVADPASIAFPASLRLGKLQSCLGTRSGSFRTVVRLAVDGSVIAARTGGLGDKDAEACISSTLVGIKASPVELITEIACDFQRGDATPWRISLDAGYTVIEAGKGERAGDPADATRTFVVVLEPTTPAAAISQAMASAARGAGVLVALRVDAGPPLYVAAGPSAAVVADPTTPLTLDTNDPVAICGGQLDEPKSAPFAQADQLLAAASRRCTHRPCPAMLTISVGTTRTAQELAALAGAARGVDFERIVFGPGSCAH